MPSQAQRTCELLKLYDDGQFHELGSPRKGYRNPSTFHGGICSLCFDPKDQLSLTCFAKSQTNLKGNSHDMLHHMLPNSAGLHTQSYFSEGTIWNCHISHQQWTMDDKLIITIEVLSIIRLIVYSQRILIYI